jgi:hypothetical protein
MVIYIVFCYDDGVLEVYNTKEAAEAYIEYVHKNMWYHKEDCMIIEKTVNK